MMTWKGYLRWCFEPAGPIGNVGVAGDGTGGGKSKGRPGAPVSRDRARFSACAAVIAWVPGCEYDVRQNWGLRSECQDPAGGRTLTLPTRRMGRILVERAPLEAASPSVTPASQRLSQNDKNYALPLSLSALGKSSRPS